MEPQWDTRGFADARAVDLTFAAQQWLDKPWLRYFPPRPQAFNFPEFLPDPGQVVRVLGGVAAAVGTHYFRNRAIYDGIYSLGKGFLARFGHAQRNAVHVPADFPGFEPVHGDFEPRRQVHRSSYFGRIYRRRRKRSRRAWRRVQRRPRTFGTFL